MSLGLDPEGREIPAFAFPLTSVAVSFSKTKRRFCRTGCIEGAI